MLLHKSRQKLPQHQLLHHQQRLRLPSQQQLQQLHLQLLKVRLLSQQMLQQLSQLLHRQQKLRLPDQRQLHLQLLKVRLSQQMLQHQLHLQLLKVQLLSPVHHLPPHPNHQWSQLLLQVYLYRLRLSPAVNLHLSLHLSRAPNLLYSHRCAYVTAWLQFQTDRHVVILELKEHSILVVAAAVCVTWAAIINALVQ